VVIGGDYQGLGIIRSLGRRGIPVCVVDDETSIGRFSRYATDSIKVDDLRSEEGTVATVLDACERLGLEGWVLFPTREETVAAFSRHRSVLATRFRVPTPDWDCVRWAWDKRNTYRLAEALDIPTPVTHVGLSELELEAADALLPVAIKPAIKEHFIYATGAKAWRADTTAQLRERFREAAQIVPAGEIMVQELIPGDGREQFAYGAFFKEGRALGSMVARRWRQHPPEFGRASTYVETIDVPLLEELSERLLREIGYYGLVELEYKRDPRDGRFKLLDFNARTWGYHTIGGRAGVDFPYRLYADQVGLAVQERRAQAGVKWVRLVTDVPTGFVEIANGRLDVRAYLRSLRETHVEAVFSSDDLLPGLVELALIPYLAVRRGF
jgi:predicted ATP-grasp superfamily ATP-dependent carboligase